MSKLHITVTNDGKTVYDADGDMLMLGVLKDRDCETITEGKGTNAAMALIVASLLRHIEETTNEHPELAPLVLLADRFMKTYRMDEEATP